MKVNALARTVEQWLKIFDEQTDGTELSVSARILEDLWGYNTHTPKDRYRPQDTQSLANALAAFRIRSIVRLGEKRNEFNCATIKNAT